MKLLDGHCDTLLGLHFSGAPVGALADNRLHIDLKRAAGAFESYGQLFAIFGIPEMAPDGDIFDILYARFLAEMEACGELVRFCRSQADAALARAEGKSAAFLSVEGAEVLGCSTEKLEEAARKGVISLCLTWNRPTVLTGSCSEDKDRGLSKEGEDYVRLASKLGMVLDVSHLSDPGFWDLEKLIDGPFIASHSNSRDVFGHPRNLTDDMFRAIRDHGGTAGLNLYAAFLGEGEVSIDHTLRHVEHFLELGGEKTLAIGGDLDGCEALPAGMTGVQDVRLLYEELQRRGYSEELLEDIFYRNLLRVLPE